MATSRPLLPSSRVTCRDSSSVNEIVSIKAKVERAETVH